MRVVEFGTTSHEAKPSSQCLVRILAPKVPFRGRNHAPNQASPALTRRGGARAAPPPPVCG